MLAPFARGEIVVQRCISHCDDIDDIQRYILLLFASDQEKVVFVTAEPRGPSAGFHTTAIIRPASNIDHVEHGKLSHIINSCRVYQCSTNQPALGC